MAFAYVLSSSNDEGFADIINWRPNNVRRQPTHFDEFDDTDFHAWFRLSKECVIKMLEAIECKISYPNGKYIQHYNSIVIRVFIVDEAVIHE